MILSKLAKSLAPQMRVNAFGCFRSSSSSQVPKMPDCEFKFEPDKNFGIRNIEEIKKKHLNYQFQFYPNSPMFTQGRMQWLWDENGKRYLDMFGGVAVISMGHSHPKVVASAMEQINKLWHITSGFNSLPRYEYAEKLASKMPGDLKVVYFANSGTEANELAIMMARLYTGAYDLISLRKCYHGTSADTRGLTAIGGYKYDFPAGFGIHHAMNPDPYRGIWGGSHCRDSPVQTTRTCDCAPDQCAAKDNYVNQLREVLYHSVAPKIAGFIAEPIQGAGGNIQFTKGYLKEAYELVRGKGGLCISDEVQTGFGRTGTHMWGFESHGVMPDIVTMAKGIANGLPMAAVVTTPAVSEAIKRTLYVNTFGGNPITCAAASAVLDLVEENQTMQNCAIVGNHIMKQLEKLRNEYDVVGDVSGKGLMIGIDLVEDKQTKIPFTLQKTQQLAENIKDMGVIVEVNGSYGNSLALKPPMCITKEDGDFAVAVIKKALDNMSI